MDAAVWVWGALFYGFIAYMAWVVASDDERFSGAAEVTLALLWPLSLLGVLVIGARDVYRVLSGKSK